MNGDGPEAREASGERRLEDYHRTPRSMAGSHWLTQKDLARRQPRLTLLDYLELRVAKWVWHYLRSRFGSKHPLAEYPNDSADRGIYPLRAAAEEPGREVRLSLAGDWATGTREAARVATGMRRFDPHYTIHLGDIYYVGTPREVRENFFERVQWPPGSLGSFALNGNHEMYANGVGYFRDLLPRLGLSPASDRGRKPQRTSFFALENEYWRVIALDTGYHSTGIPLLELIFPASHRLPDRQLEWLEREVRLDREEDTRGIVLLSHHQYYSAFENEYPKAARQLADYLSRPVLWIWGHEHRLALYGRARRRGGVEAYGRCIGHGGMPVEKIDRSPRKGAAELRLAAYDHRERGVLRALQGDRSPRNVRFGYNGFANLTFSGDELRIEYRDHREEASLLLTEGWRIDTATGRLEGLGVERHLDDPALVSHTGDLADAQR